MFRRLSDPLPLSEASLLYFRPALNAPVLNVGYLPIGPARAAVVAFGEEYGGIGIALGVRANESGQLAVLRNQESIDFDVPLAEALEPLLAEAERMGFLFDEDLLEESPGQAGRARAMAQWADLMGGMEKLIPPPSPDPDELRRAEDDGPVGPLSPSQAVEEMQYPELMLDHVAPFELPDDGDAALDVEETETLEPDLEVDPGPAGVRSQRRVFVPDFDEPLEHGLDEALEGALDDSLGDPLDGPLDERLDGREGSGAGDPAFDDLLLGESDLTEPTAPIAPPRARDVKPAAIPAPRIAVPAAAPQPADAPAAAARSVRPAAPSVAPAKATIPRDPEASIPSPAPASKPAVIVAPPTAKGRSGENRPIAPIPVPPAAPAAPPVPILPSVPVAKATPPVPPRVVLSKFRNPEGLRGADRVGDPSEVGTDRSSELARIPIVRVRRGRSPANKKVPFLARLLSSF